MLPKFPRMFPQNFTLQPFRSMRSLKILRCAYLSQNFERERSGSETGLFRTFSAESLVPTVT